MFKKWWYFVILIVILIGAGVWIIRPNLTSGSKTIFLLLNAGRDIDRPNATIRTFIEVSYDSSFTQIEDTSGWLLSRQGARIRYRFVPQSSGQVAYDRVYWWRAKSMNVYGVESNWCNAWYFTITQQNEKVSRDTTYLPYPNPFNRAINISYSLSEKGNVKVIVYNLLGQKVDILVDEEQTEGFYQLIWDGTNSNGEEIGTGIYFLLVKLGNKVKVTRIVMLK